MSRYVDLDERVTAQFYDQECEEWTMQTVAIADVLDSVCDEYTVLPSAQPELRTAYWTKDIVGSVICSKCGGIRKDNRISHMNFCNCCGADMRGTKR